MTFWDCLDASDLLKIGSLIVVGDFNATISLEECWGTRRRKDPIGDRLQMNFYPNHLMDIRPYLIVPTRHNGRAGPQHIGKRLDQFLVHETLVERLGLLHSEVWNFTSWIIFS